MFKKKKKEKPVPTYHDYHLNVGDGAIIGGLRVSRKNMNKLLNDWASLTGQRRIQPKTWPGQSWPYEVSGNFSPDRQYEGDLC